jgi:hypothetical protein
MIPPNLLRAVLGHEHLGAGAEVVMLQASSGFFSYEPVLKALQCKTPLPLAKYILQDGLQGSSSSSISAGAASSGSSSSGLVVPEVPAYAASPFCTYDLTSCLEDEQLHALTADQRTR